METEETKIEEAAPTETVAAPAGRTCTVKTFVCDLMKQTGLSISASEIILFASAFVVIPLIDLIAGKLIQTSALGSILQKNPRGAIFFVYALYILFSIAAFLGAKYLTKEKKNAIGSFLYSFSSVALLLSLTALLPILGGNSNPFIGLGILGAGMLLLTGGYLYLSKRVENSGATFLIGAVVTIAITLLSLTQLFNIPCTSAMQNGSENAAKLCSSIQTFTGIFIPLAAIAIGYFTWKKD